MVAYNINDLQFILQQIKIAEANATKDNGSTGTPGTPLSQLVPHELLPWGLRTVSGINNNILPGRETFGSADQPFPRLTDPHVFTGTPGSTIFDSNGSLPGGTIVSNTNYGAGQTVNADGTLSGPPANVVDIMPRLISNLIVDQTLNNPAAVMAALSYAGYEGAAAKACFEEIMAARLVLSNAGSGVAAALGALNAAQAAYNAANHPAAIAAANGAVTTATTNLATANSNYSTAQNATAAAVTAQTATAATLATEQGELNAANAALVAATQALAALLNGAIDTPEEQAIQTTFNNAAIALIAAQQAVPPRVTANNNAIAAETAAQNASNAANTAEATAIADLGSANTAFSNAQIDQSNAIATQTAANNQLTSAQNLVGQLQAAIAAGPAAIAAAETTRDNAQAAHDLGVQGAVDTENEIALQTALTNASDIEAAALADFASAQTALATAGTDLAAAQATYDQAVFDFGVDSAEALAALAVLDAAVLTEAAAQATFDATQTVYTDAQTNTANAQSAFDNGVVGAVDNIHEQALADALASAETTLANAQTVYNSALAALPGALDAETAAQLAVGDADAAVIAATAAVAAAQTAVTDAQAALTTAEANADAAALSLASASAAQDITQAALDAANALVATRTQAFNDAFTDLSQVLNTEIDTPEEIAADAAVDAAQAAYNAALAERDAADSANDAALAAITTAQTNEAAALAAVGTATAALSAAEGQVAAAVNAENISQGAINSAQTALDIAEGGNDAAQLAFDAVLAEYSITMHEDGTVDILNQAPDEGISAPFNSWMTLFGQFFDHGLDLVEKGATTTVYIPLLPDDPLYNPNSNFNFLTVTRTLEDAKNITSPFVDQNQTYSSHPSKQVFLREYELDANGDPQATGKLLEGADGGLANWAEVKAHALAMLGIQLVDANIGNVPLLATDDYGRFLRGPNGFPLVVKTDGTLVEGDPANPVLIDASVVKTGHAFLDDIAFPANPNGRTGPLTADADSTAGSPASFLPPGVYDNELLDAHYVTGDGRGNENIGLTAVHHVFHSEHNRLMEQTKDLLLSNANTPEGLALLNEWLDTPVTSVPADLSTLDWNGERLFQTARVGTEMQYQHMVFEEFARKVNPAVDLFVFNPTMDIDPAIFGEFAHVVYRFGHSMLNENVDRLAADGQTTDNIGLIEAFLNPVAFENGQSADIGAGEIIRGMTRQQGNEIDEFVTDALRNNLLGRPLDLAAINIARGRDTEMATLNEARADFHAMTGSEWLKPYTSWVDFAQNLKNPMSIVNFVAAYGTHDSITSATTVEDKRDAAMALVLGGTGAPADRLDFLTARGAYATDGLLGGLQNVDLWIGGLAESILPFGGMLGSTFTFVFEAQLERLQNGDRFYYLSRMQGTHFLQELENNSFASIVMKNTDLGELQDLGGGVMGRTHLPGELFSTPQLILESHLALQTDYNGAEVGKDPNHEDEILAALEPKVSRNGDLVVDGNSYDNSLKFTGGEHVVLGGTEGNDVLIADLGDDTVWGDGGDDFIIGGHGINRLHGGEGDDIIYGGGDAEFIHGEAGNDVIAAGNGVGDLIFAGSGNDFVLMGEDAKETFGGEGNDFILGTRDTDVLLGGEGDDWLEGGEGFDGISGDNSELFFNSAIIGHDVMFAGTNESDFDAESGDDIMIQGESVIRSEGMIGFDWVSYEEHTLRGADMDMNQVFAPTAGSTQLDILRNRFDRVEAASGSSLNDLMVGDSRIADVGGIPDPNVLPNEATLLNDELNASGALRITGLSELLGLDPDDVANMDPNEVVFAAGNILIGGGGSDIIEGRGGDDRIDGDVSLNVRIGIKHPVTGEIIGSAEKMQGIVTSTDPALNGQPLDRLMFDRSVNGGNLVIIREIIDSNNAADIDIARFRGNRSEYEIVTNGDGTLTVSHLTPATAALDDGTDTLSNIERLQFADVTIDATTINNAPTLGSLALSIANGPNVLFNLTTRLETGDVLTATQGTVTDADTLPAFDGAAVTWQEGILDVDGVTIIGWQTIIDPATTLPVSGASFTVTDAQAGVPLRAVWNVLDGAGNLVNATSAATANVLGPDGLLPIVQDPVATLAGVEDTVITIGRADLLPGVDPNPITEAVDFINFIVRTRAGDPVQGTLGNLVTDANGFVSIEFTPTQDFNGGLTINFETVDAGGNSFPSELVINVAPVNDAPVNPAAQVGTTPAGTGVGPVTFTLAQLFGATPTDANGRPLDVDGDRLTIVGLGVDPNAVTASIGTVTFDDVTEIFTWTPPANTVFPEANNVSFAFEIDDGSGELNGVVPASATIDAINLAPTGAPTISDTTPTAGQTLTASSLGLNDVNGIGPITFTWQAFDGTDWNDVGTGATFLASATFAGQQLRVVGTYTDQGGTAETVTSAPTAPVFINTLPVGLPTMSDAGPTQGVSLSANAAGITDANGLGAFTYQWQQSVDGLTWNNVGGGAGAFAAGNVNFTPGAAQAGQFIRVNARFTDAAGTTETVSSLASERVVGSNVGAITGLGGASTINGNAGDDLLAGGGGNDTVNGNAGSDTITWGVTNPIAFIAPNGLSDGRDLVNGGTEPVTGIGDTFVINGNSQAEIYRIYSNMDDLNPLLAGLQTSAAAAGLTGLNTATEIVITRNTNGVGGAVTNANIIAELADIEEIIINTGAGADTVLPVGNFTPTNLAFNTITINAGSGDDTVDVSGLGSEHHVVLNTGGGADTLLGERAQDELNVQTVAPDAVINLTETYRNVMQIRESSLHNLDYGRSSHLLDGNDATFIHTSNGANEWIELDLGGSFDVTTVSITNRDAVGYRLDGAIVTLLDGTGAVVHTYGPISNPANGEVIEINLPTSVNAHTVHIQGAPGEYLHVAELKVFGSGTPDPVGANLTDTYHAYMQIEESSLYHSAYDGANAVDDNATTFAHTSNGANEWIEMDLGGSFDISCLVLKNRDVVGYRLNGAVVTLHDAQDNEVYAFDPISSAEDGESFRFMLPSGVNAHSVRISGVPNEYLQIAELDVFGAGSPDQAPLFTLGGDHGFALTASDIAGLHNLISGQPDAEGESEVPLGVRDLSGFDSGVPDTNFIRLTDAHYGPNGAINPLFADLDARAISNILGAQELDLGKNAAGSNIFFMAFGQYFDHGLDFLAKGGSGKIIIDGADAYGPMGQPANFADITRGTQTGVDENGDPLHTNKTSVFVDQNQAYGSHKLVGEFLRESDGNGGFGSHLLTGAADPMAPGFHLLPTLRELILHHIDEGTEFSNGQTLLEAYPTLLNGDGTVNATAAAALASNFMGSGQNLLIDANRGVSVLDHFIAGDGRLNENISLTAMHTVWARNHNFHVENLEAAGFTGTPTEIYEAAKMLNEAEYQRVVFTEFADHLIGGIQGVGDHGFKEHNPDADPRISHEFAAAVYRVGHSLVADTLTVLDADGQPIEVRLVDAFLNPASYASHGVGNILGGIAGQQAEEVDFNIVDAVRNDLVGTRADLFAFNVARGWDVGLGTLNQVRAGLAASTDGYVQEAVGYAGNLSPYTSWEDFQARNGLSDLVIGQFKAAYPDLVLEDQAAIDAFVAANRDITLVNGNTVKGIDRVDLWVGGLAETHINGGQVGQTFWVVLHEQFDRLQEADEFYYIDRFDNFDLYQGEFEATSFAGIVARNTGLTNLPEDIFSATPAEVEDTANVVDAEVIGNTDETTGEAAGGGVDENTDGGNDSDGGEANIADGNIAPPSSLIAVSLAGDAGDNMLVGAGSDDTLMGNGGDDALIGGDGADILSGGAGDDLVRAGDGDDTIFGGADNDDIFADEGDDVIKDGSGADNVFGGDGDDTIIATLDNAVDNYNGGNIGSDTSANDTLDMSAITQAIEANMRVGYARTGSTYDVMQGIENIVTGSGDDVITASASVNHMNGGAGDDTFVFNSAGDADFDVIDGFQAGDKIDLSNFMGNGGTVSLVNGTAAQGEVGFTFERVNGEEFTVLRGNLDSDVGEEFTIHIRGHHNLTGSNIV
jgi:Ca2+-binding RTX toxin-like protein